MNALLQLEGWDITLNVLSRLARGKRPRRSARFNPNTPGVIREGSATAAVLEFLAAHPGRWFGEAEIAAATGASRSRVSTSILYLRQQGKVISRPRHLGHRYLDYSLAPA